MWGRTGVMAVFLMVLLSSTAQAQLAVGYGLPIGLETARKVATAAIAEAKKNNWTMAVAIVDTGGHLVYFERLDMTQSGSVEVALRKAQTANNFKRPSKAFEDAVAGGRTAVLGLPGVVPIEGGLPIVVDGKLIGAIGVSGGTSVQDGQAAKVGVDALAAK